MPENKRCLGCMKEIGNNTVCPYCGYIEGTPHLPTYLEPGTILQERYVVGKLLSYNGEGATYIAFDKSLESIVELREYLPDALANREENSSNVHIIAGCETQYKALMAEFIELSNMMTKFRTLTHVIQVYEVFEANNTVYAIHEHVDGCVPLRQYLMQNAGELNWQEAVKMFTPLMTTLGVLHASNIIHRGISPETILVTKRNELKLDGFCISACRAAKSELSAQLFAGYAAPEQYSTSSWHGPWTDVYALGAVLYKALTGTMPPEAMSRSINDNLLDPHTLNPSIPKQISDVIMDAMRLSPDNRIQTMRELSNRLSQPVPVNEPIAIKDTEEEPEEPPKSTKKYGLVAAGVTFGVLLVIAVLIIMFVLGGNEEPITGSEISIPDYSSSISSQAASDDGKNFGMPNLVGLVYETVKVTDDYTSMLKITPKYEYNESYAKGIIFEQTIEVNTPISLGTEVTVTVSLGSQFPRIPDYYGLQKEEYIAELERLGITNYEIVEEAAAGRDNGYVLRLDREPGTTIDINSEDTLKIYVVSNPESSEVPSSEESSRSNHYGDNDSGDSSINSQGYYYDYNYNYGR